MLLWFVVAYWIVSVAIGLFAARWVHNTKDFAVAGRRLPMYIVTATVFATWFGSETVLGIPATFIQEGFGGVIADPFGSSLCLVLVGLFFARPLYRMNLLTIGDYYRKRFSRPVEMLTSLCIVISYLGWVGAQIKALGLVFNVVSGGWLSEESGMIIGSATVLVYTMLGGMFSVAITDFIQMIIIVLGMLYIGGAVSSIVPGGAAAVIAHAAHEGKFHMLPAFQLKDILFFFTAWITMMLGSIPQQDVFQRVQSAKDENTAARSTSASPSSRCSSPTRRASSIRRWSRRASRRIRRRSCPTSSSRPWCRCSRRSCSSGRSCPPSRAARARRSSRRR